MAQTLFFYGTLRHQRLLDIVLGRSFAPSDLKVGVLPDYAVRAVAEGPFPTLIPAQGDAAHGLVVSGLSQSDLERLDFYEGGFDYDLVPVILQDGTQAQVYMSPEGLWTATDPWDLGVWEDDWAQLSCHAAREVMSYLGRRDRTEVAQMFPQIRARAWSRVLGERGHAGQGVLQGSVTVEHEERAYAGFFALDEVTLRHEQFDGSQSPALERSYFVGVDAALVLPYDPVRDRVLLIEQVRVGPLGRRDPELWQLEPVAGRVDPGETPEQTALREAREEASVTITTLETVARGYPSPGTSTDYFHIFVGLADLPDTATGVGGLESEDEDIRSHLISFDRLMEMAENRNLANTPLTLLAYWLAFHRKRLRS